MFTKLTISNVVITNTNTTNGVITESTTLKIDNVSIEEEVTVEEVSKVLEAAVNLLQNKQKKTKEEQKKQINAFNQQFLITVFKYKDKEKFAIIKDNYGNHYTLSIDGLARYGKENYAYKTYEEKVFKGECTMLRKFYADYIPTYEEL